MSMLKEQFSLLRSFLRTGFRKTVLLCAAGFLAAGVAGYFIGIMYPDIVRSVFESFMTNAENAGVIREDGSLSVFALLANNWKVMLISVAYGFLPFIFLPAILIVSNGFVVGISGAMYHIYNQKLTLWLAALLPHGIFELTAFILSTACGIHLCICLCRSIISSPFRTPILITLCDILRVMMLLVAPLTIVAAFIEVYVTPLIMAIFM